MPYPQLISIPNHSVVAPKKHAASKPIQKPLHPIGTRIQIHSNFGIIKNYHCTDKNYGYGTQLLYDVLLDNGDVLENLPDYQVRLKVDYKLFNRKWKGVTNVKDGTSQDLWAKLVGWYSVETKEGPVVFSTLVEAMRAYDKEVVRWKGYETKREDLNLLRDWEWLVGTESKRSVFYEDSSTDDDDNANGDNTPPSSLRSKKKRKSSSDDDDESYREESEKRRRKTASSSRVTSGGRQRCKRFKGVSYRENERKYYAYFALCKKTKFLGGYKLACDAAYVADTVTREVNGASKKPNFDSYDHFLENRIQEIKEVGLSLVAVGTVHDLKQKIQAQIAKVAGNTSDTSRAAKKSKATEVSKPDPFDKLDEASVDESLKENTIQPPRSHEQEHSRNEATLRERCLNYKGVSLQKSSHTFMAYITLNKKTKYLGNFFLASDSAYVVNWAYESLTGQKQNFSDFESYAIARDREIEEDGLVVSDVGKIESIVAKVTAKIAKIRDELKLDGRISLVSEPNGTKKDIKLSWQTNNCTTKDSKKMPPKSSTLTASTTFSQLHSAEKENRSLQSKKMHLKQPSSKSAQTKSIRVNSNTNVPNPESRPSLRTTMMRERCINYKGVSFMKADMKYKSFIQIAKKTQCLGVYRLACDAAFAFDHFVKFRVGSEPNFSNLQHYQQVRNQEMNDTGLDVTQVGTVESLKSKIAVYYEKISNEISSSQKSEKTEGSLYDDRGVSFNKNIYRVRKSDAVYLSHYKGVSFIKDKYRVRKNNKWYGGGFDLITDAAFVYDEVLENVVYPRETRLHFATKQHFLIARSKEMRDKGLTVADVGTFIDLQNRISMLIQENNESRMEQNHHGHFECARSSIFFGIQNDGIRIMTSHFDKTACELATLFSVSIEANNCVDLTASP